MIPTDNIDDNEDLATQTNNLNSVYLHPDIVDSRNDNHFAFKPWNYGSRTDQPRLAYEIYLRLIENVIMNRQPQPNNNLNFNQNPNQKPFDTNSLLVAAYTGCNLVYRN